jgi:hypothetical protein
MSAALSPPGIAARNFSAGPGRQLKNWTDIRDFVFAGHAIFTLRSLKTGMRYTYEVKVKKADVEREYPLAANDITYFVSVLRGPDNTDHFSYAGVLHRPGRFWITQASRVLRSAGSVKALLWFLAALVHERDVLGGDGKSPLLEVWHEGRCGRCGRRLTVPESVERGLGADCAGMEGQSEDCHRTRQ